MNEEENLRIRAKSLASKQLNGFDCVTVDVISQRTTILDVHFINDKKLSQILASARSIYNNEERAHELFPISGGDRIPAGKENDQLKVREISDSPTMNSLSLTVEPTGDYSIYTLTIGEYLEEYFDPIFNSVRFKMRPGCFNTICSKPLISEESFDEPFINYLAKDYESFKHLMISDMGSRVPGWKPTSEADLDIVLIELICAVADELSDYQDRVMNEAYFCTARKRVSLARHSRLMDYHIFQGNQASTWIALLVRNAEECDGENCELPRRFEVRVKDDIDIPKRIVFSTKKSHTIHDLLNWFSLYTWSDTRLNLAKGSTSADLRILLKTPGGMSGEKYEESNEPDHYEIVRELFSEKQLHLLIQERKYTKEGLELEGLTTSRQVVQIVNQEVGVDPLTEYHYLRVYWDKSDELKNEYRIVNDKKEIINIFFHGNLAKVYHGEFKSASFVGLNEGISYNTNQFFYERTKWGAICRLPQFPVSYEDVYKGNSHDGKIPSKSTCQVHVQYEDGNEEEWEERINFIHSDGFTRHFVVETDETQESIIRFGNGINGKRLPENATVHCSYQVGLGNEGNIGADILTEFMVNLDHEYFQFMNIIEKCWNPLEVRNGQEPELVEEILRKVPEAYKSEQYRAITVNDQVDDYEKRAQELNEVSKAHARYAWMGNWRLVQLSIDPISIMQDPQYFADLEKKLLFYIESVRLIGDKVIIKQAEYVSLEIRVKICVNSNYWIGNIQDEINAEFTSGYTPDGRKGFFHPDRWTFGQSLRKSQLIGKIQEIKGVEYVIANPQDPLIIRKWMHAERDVEGESLTIQPNEIIQVKNDPMQIEKGFMFVNLLGGRR